MSRRRMWKEVVIVTIITLSIFSFLVFNNNLILTASMEGEAWEPLE